MSTVDTSAAAVERLAAELETSIVPGVVVRAAPVAATLRALLAERDALLGGLREAEIALRTVEVDPRDARAAERALLAARVAIAKAEGGA